MPPTVPSAQSSPREFTAKFSLNRLKPGVDNVRYDVWLSTDFRATTATLVRTIIANNLPIKNLPGHNTATPMRELKSDFAEQYQQMMFAALSLAKQQNKEPQIDLVALLAVCKMIKQEIQSQFAELIDIVNNRIWETELSKRHNPRDALQMKEALAAFRQQKKSIIARTTTEVFKAKFSGGTDKLTGMRTSLFGANQNMRPEDLLLNPVLFTDPDQLTDDLMLEQYVLLSQRQNEEDRYDTLQIIIKDLLREASGADSSPDGPDDSTVDRWLKEPENFDLFFNAYTSTDKNEAAARDTRLEVCYQRFQKMNLIDRIVTAREMQPIAGEFNPPLGPHQLLTYILTPSARKEIDKQIERHQKFFHCRMSLVPLQELAKQLPRITKERKKEHLLNFLKGFSRYHRDYTNTMAVREIMERVNVVDDEKTRELSQANTTLYEFLLPHEQAMDLGPGVITGHVIIKANISGATTITECLLGRNLNPASYFSLNFFEPISKVISAYGAAKLFIESDAIVLSISEYENSDDWFGVARVCGLAVSIVKIIARYNNHGAKNDLPPLEVGCGISRRNSAPTYLFDDDHKIMVSPAINRADWLASSPKNLRRLLADRPKKFNLYVFADRPWDKKTEAEGEDLLWRYNVNGIELDQTGFEALSKEITLKKISCTVPDLLEENHTLYTGTFPLLNGKFQRIIIREADIFETKPGTLEVVQPTGQKYYEICTSPALYDQVKKIA